MSTTLSLGLVLFSLMLITSETSALKCWRCSSDSTDSQFCNERLDLSLLTPQQKNYYLIECGPPVVPINANGQKMVSKCRMTVQKAHGSTVYSRHCAAEEENAERTACKVRNVLPEVRILACETCQEDGCNAFLVGKPEELKAGDDNKSAGIRTTYSMQLFSIVFGFVWLLF